LQEVASLLEAIDSHLAQIAIESLQRSVADIVPTPKKRKISNDDHVSRKKQAGEKTVTTDRNKNLSLSQRESEAIKSLASFIEGCGGEWCTNTFKVELFVRTVEHLLLHAMSLSTW